MPDQMVRVWDLPLRLVHWSLVLLVAFQIYSGNVGGNLMRWHMLAGYAILAMVLFRLAWGVAGSTTARFSHFVAGPRAALGFGRGLLAGKPVPHASHNPLGAWMVLALLAALAVQAGSGLFANDDISTEGPLAALVSKATSDRMTGVHHRTQRALLGLIAGHVGAVLYHWGALKENLVGAMFTGVKRLPAELVREMAAVRFASSWRALGLLVAAAVLVWLLVSKIFLKP